LAELLILEKLSQLK